MKPKFLLYPLILVGAFLFHLLFWREGIGINLLIQTTFVTGCLFLLSPTGVKTSTPFQLSLLGLWATALFAAVHASTLSVFMWATSLVLVNGFYHQTSLRSIHYSLTQAIAGFFAVPSSFLSNLPTGVLGKNRTRQGAFILRSGWVPVAIVGVFILIYAAANPKLASLIDRSTGKFASLWERLFENVSTPSFFFLVLGFIFTAWMLLPSITNRFALREHGKSDFLTRTRKAFKVGCLVQALKRENMGALLLLIMINSVLLVVNAIDVSWVWTKFNWMGDVDFSSFVHEGTYLLIFSILLSMGILLYIFRGNQNFYYQNKRLRWLAVAWVIQNGFLVLSVGMRNFHYMNAYGLSHKRIGVFIFLLATLFGLYTLLRKITETRSFYYLLKTNLMALFLFFIGLSAINWDRAIVRYNLANVVQGRIDVHDLLDMNDSVLPLLKAEPGLLDLNLPPHRYDRKYNIHTRKRFENRLLEFEEKMALRSNISWNWADAQTAKSLKQNS